MSAGDENVQLMLAFQGGDDSAYATLFERWAQPLLRFLQQMVGDSATAEELVQEAFLRVYRAKESYTPDAKFSTWLYRIGTNLALNELRRPRRKNPHEASDAEDYGPELVAGGDSAEEIVRACELESAVVEELTRIPERQRAALLLVAVQGLSYAEAAEALGDATEKSVKALVHRARAALALRFQRVES